MILFDVLSPIIGIIWLSQATWYGGPLFEGNVMRNGDVFRGSDPTVIAVGVDEDGEPLIELGTKLTICRADLSRCADGVVQDTGYLGENLDVSPALFEQLAPLSVGRIKIMWYERSE